MRHFARAAIHSHRVPLGGKCVLAAILLTFANASAGANAQWEQLASLPVPNGGFAAGESGGRIIVAGGVTWRDDTKIWLDRIWLYDPARNSWSESGRLPSPLAYPVTGVKGDTLWFACGSSGESTHHTLWQIDAARPPRVVATLDRGFVNAAGALIGTSLYVVGGTDDQARVDRATNAFRAIDIKSGAMTPLPEYPEPSLITGTAAAAEGRLFVFGGARWDATIKGVVNHASAYAYDPAGKRWEKLPPLPHPGRGLAAITLDNRHILVAGGYRNDEVEFVPNAYLFDLQSETYTPTTPLPYAAMVSLVKAGDWLYCIGGEDRKRHRTAAVFRIRWRSLLLSNSSTVKDKI
jgi:N-acetylneuraminic acid mutarotase